MTKFRNAKKTRNSIATIVRELHYSIKLKICQLVIFLWMSLWGDWSIYTAEGDYISSFEQANEFQTPSKPGLYVALFTHIEL